MKTVPAVVPRAQVVVAALWAAAGTIAVALAGTWASELGPWYRALRQPDWKPSDLWFGPVWTLIYTLAAVAAVKAWFGCASRHERTRLVAALVLNGLLNVLWSWLFFRARRPDWALAEVGLLWLSIVLLIVLAGRASDVAAWLLAPYLLWVAFAALLNFAVVRLNAPF
jgi:tryptophan-rich sensory protein